MPRFLVINNKKLFKKNSTQYENAIENNIAGVFGGRQFAYDDILQHPDPAEKRLFRQDRMGLQRP
jgi:hypothetical protein